MLQNKDFHNIPGYEGLYAINNDGDIYSFYRNKLLKQRLRSDGYLDVKLTKNKASKKILVHRLFAKTFIANPLNKPQINHINGNKVDISIKNLEWVTCSENAIHASKNGLREKQKQLVGQYVIKHLRKLTDCQVKEIKTMYKTGNIKQSELSKIYNVTSSTICRMLNNKTYKQEAYI